MIFNFLLIEPSTPENVGAAARAIKTMGFSRLRLINPCNYLCPEAQWLAHGSTDVLEQAQVFDSFESALSDLDFVIGTTAKKRSAKEDYIPVNLIHKLIESKGYSIRNIGIAFGREDTGMRNRELKLCHTVSTIPLENSYPSLNLAQAVMIYAYELSGIKRGDSLKLDSSPGSFLLLHHKIKDILQHIGMPDGSNIHHRVLERLALLDDTDIHLLHSVCQKLNKKYGIY